MRYQTEAVGETAWLLGELPSGGVVTITLYKLSDSSTPALDSNACTEIGATGIYKWATTNITTPETTKTEYLYVMTDGTLSYFGKIVVGGYVDDVENGATIADVVWDEVLTGAAHNVPTSAGRRLRQAADVMIIREETCQAGGGNDEIILDVGASATNEFYINDLIVLTSGTGVGQQRHIDSYVGATKTATVNRAWTTNPDATTNFVIKADSTKHVHGFETEAKAEIESEANDALVALKLDHLVAVPDGDDPVNNCIIAQLAAADGDWSNFAKASDSLEALRNRGDIAWLTATGFSTHNAAAIWAVGSRELSTPANYKADVSLVALEATLTAMKQTTAGAFDRDTDSLEAIRNRGDAAWITATGFAKPSDVKVTGGGGGGGAIIERPAIWKLEEKLKLIEDIKKMHKTINELSSLQAVGLRNVKKNIEEFKNSLIKLIKEEVTLLISLKLAIAEQPQTDSSNALADSINQIIAKWDSVQKGILKSSDISSLDKKLDELTQITVKTLSSKTIEGLVNEE